MIFDIFNSIIAFIRGNLSKFEFVSLFISGVMLWFIVYFNAKLGLTQEKVEHWFDVWSSHNIIQRRSLKAWRKIRERLETGDGNQLRIAISEADKILEEILKLAGFPGETLDEKLKKMNESHLSLIDEIRQAHRIKNRIIQDPNFYLSQGEAEIAVDIYRRAFVELGLIEERD